MDLSTNLSRGSGLSNLLFDHVVEREFEARTVDAIDCLTDMHWHRNWELPQFDYANFTIFRKHCLPLPAAVLPGRTKPALKRVLWIQALACRRARSRPAGEDM